MSGLVYPEIVAGSGNFPEAAAQVTTALKTLDSRVDEARGFGGYLIGATIGDSMGGNAGGPQTDSGVSQGLASPLCWAQMLHGQANIYWDVRADRGGYAEGGTRTERMLTHQLPLIRQRLPTVPADFFLMSSMQNDGVGDRAGAVTSTNNVKEAIRQLLDLGQQVIVQGNFPYNGIATPDREYALYYSNDLVRNFCAKTPGTHFIDSLDLLKEKADMSAELAAQGEVRWRGPQGGKYGTGGDTAHRATLAGYLEGPLYAEAFAKIASKYRMPSFGLAEYDASKNEFGSFFYSRGLFRGIGGTFNGVTSSNVPEGIAVTVEAGANITPSIITLDDGGRALRLTSDGSTPTASGMIEIALLSTKTAAGNFEAYGNVQDIGASGWSGIEMAVNAHALGSWGSPSNLIPGVSNRRYLMRTPKPRYFSNNFGGTQRMTFRWGFVQGEPLLGAVQVEKACYVQTDINL